MPALFSRSTMPDRNSLLGSTSHPADDVRASGGIGHQGNLLGMHLKHQIHEFGRRIALDVQLHVDQRTQIHHVGTAYVAFVGTRMHSYALGSEALAVYGHLLHRRTVLATGIAQGWRFC